MDNSLKPKRIAFITNFCPHYRVKTFEVLSQYLDVDFFFFSKGDEEYFEGRNRPRRGNFNHEYLPGFYLNRKLRITPSLFPRLVKGNYDVIVKCINGRFALPIAYVVARLTGKPFVLWSGLWTHPRSLFHRLSYPMTKYIYNQSDAIVVYGRHVKTYLVSLGVDPRKVFIAWHAHDNPQFQSPVSEEEIFPIRKKLGIDAKRVILFVGRLEPVKGLHYLIEAFSSINVEDASLVLVGTGSAEEQLKELCAQKGLANVVFAGFVPVEQLNPYYSLADIFVLPSVTVPAGRELWGLVINEAMNFGLPIITTDAVGAAVGGLVLDGVNGVVVREQDSEELGEALEYLLGEDAVRVRMGEMAKQTILKWDDERMVEGFRDAIEYAYSRKHSEHQKHRDAVRGDAL